MELSQAQIPVELLAVIVLHETDPTDCVALKSLLDSRSLLQPSLGKLRILVYDNSPREKHRSGFPEGVFYEAAPFNAGLAFAYNHALCVAEELEASWLLILDQDTIVPDNYLSKVLNTIVSLGSDESVAAVVPRILDGEKQVSPVFICPWGVSYLPEWSHGVFDREVQATNSASVFRVSSLRKVGAFSMYFWLDYSDGYIFHQMYVHGWKVFVCGSVSVVHSLSLLHRAQLHPNRYSNILQAESAYWDLYGDSVQNLALTARLLPRIWRQRKRGHDSQILRLTWRMFVRRISVSRTHRISAWKHEMQNKMRTWAPLGTEPCVSRYRESISVCMACFNGEEYITQQLETILSQMGRKDEIIVVDDASSDKTIERILSFSDERIRLIRHGQNLGVLRSFEDAIKNAVGNILFLSDQDDLWLPDKVRVILDAFQLSPEADVVVSDAALIDGSGNLLQTSYYTRGKSFHSGVLLNLVHCHFLGCTMALRSRIKEKILPFPSDTSVMHDLWIGTSNSYCGGLTLYVDEPLVQYRRHFDNLTGNQRLPLSRKLRIRWALLRALLVLHKRRTD